MTQAISLLKLDICGYEWNTLPYLLDDPDTNKLPKHIAFEFHLYPPDFALKEFGHIQPVG
jgi:hypothetical protein